MALSTEKHLEEIIDWLVSVEAHAADVYAKGSELFAEDPAFARFLAKLAEDESKHLEMITRARELASGADLAAVSLGQTTRETVEGSFRRCSELVESGAATRDELLECIVTTEYSEWNALFLYVMNAVRRTSRGFIPAAAAIEHHKREICEYLKSDKALGRHHKRIEALPVLWKERILVVDDSKEIGDVLAALLEKEGRVEAAANGREALAMLDSEYFAAVVSDVSMPVMDGMEFYTEAVARYPRLKGRFVFFTAERGPGFRRFIEENGLRYLPKPSSMGRIREEVTDILRG